MAAKAKGTYDVLPDESVKWNMLEQKLKNICKIYNYGEIRLPIFEHSETFHRNMTDTSDMVTKETYDFKDRSDRGLTLRPEGTAGMVRAYIENKMYVDSPLTKVYYHGPMFRYERSQKGRYRQFAQFGVEAIGSSSPYIDAEVIALGVAIIKGIGLRNVVVKINTIGDDTSRTEYRDVLVKHFSQHKDELCADCKIRLEKNPLRILDCKVDKHKEFFHNVPKISSYLNKESRDHFNAVLASLDGMGIDYIVDENLVRGLDYYSHTVFEIEVNIADFGAQNVIGAGGRYEGLVRELGGPNSPAVGMSFGMERLLMALEAEDRLHLPPHFIHCYFISLGDRAKAEMPKIINLCRMGGLICDTDYNNKGIKSQFKTADKQNSMFTCILGDTEIENLQINIKNNATEEQETIGIYDVYNYIVSHLQKQSPCMNCKEDKKES